MTDLGVCSREQTIYAKPCSCQLRSASIDRIRFLRNDTATPVPDSSVLGGITGSSFRRSPAAGSSHPIPFDHTSVLRFLETRFGAEVPNLSAWRRATVGDMTSAFNFSKPDTSVPVLPTLNAADFHSH